MNPPPRITRVERPSAREVSFVRELDQPPELVWRVWTEVRHLEHWFGPAGFTLTTAEFAFRPGGVWRLIMHGPDGTDYPTRIVFRDIDPPRRFTYENGWDLPGYPIDFTVAVTFQPAGSGTRLTLHMTFADDAAVKTAVERYGVLQGGVETFERIAIYLRT